jgi:hypothetical protein
MDICDQRSEIAVGMYLFSFEIWYKQTSSAAVVFIERLSIAIKKVRKPAANNTTEPSKGFEPLEGWIRVRTLRFKIFQNFPFPFYPYHQMQMVRHQAVCECISDGRDIMAVSFQKEGIVLITSEEIFIAVCVCPYVIHPARF